MPGWYAISLLTHCSQWSYMALHVNIGSGNGVFNSVAWWHQAITWTNIDLES